MNRSTYLVMISLLVILVSSTVVPICVAEPATTRTYGGSESDHGQGIQRTADGGLILAGYTSSYGAGGADFYLIKTDAAGNMIWDATYGGAANDFCNDVAQTSDGGYILAGYTGIPPSNYEAYVVRVDADGDFLWDASFGGSGKDLFNAVRETPDGGFILCGDKAETGSLYLVKIDSEGDFLWQKTFGEGDDHGEAIEVAADGGFIIGGWQGDGSTFPEFDGWVLRTNAGGNILWQKTLDTSIDDRVFCVLQTSDGGFAAGGLIGGGMALWRFTSSGGLDWQEVYGGPSTDYANDIEQSADGGFILGGNTTQSSNLEVYFVKTDNAGVLESEEIIGDEHWEFCWALDITSDGNYALIGATNATPGGDYDYYLAIVDGSETPSGIGDVPSIAVLGLTVSPNPMQSHTRFFFELPDAGPARITVYDVRGRRIATVLDGHTGAGTQVVPWNFQGTGVSPASGVYFVRLEAAGRVDTRKIVIAK